MADAFSSRDVAAALASLGASAVPLQMYAQALLQQPVVGMDGVPALAPDLQTAHDVSRTCVDSVLPQALRVNAAAIGFINELMAMYPELLVLARQIDAGGPARPDAAARFSQGLALLCKNLVQQAPALDALATGAATLSTSAAQVSARLAADATAAAGNADITSLQQQIDATLQAIDADCQVIANGMSGTDKALVKVAVQELDCEENPKDAVTAFVGFILDVSNKYSAVVEAQNDIQRQLKTLASLYAQLDVLTFQAAVAQNASSEASLFATNATRMQSAAVALAGAWASLLGGFEALAVTLKSGGAPEPLAPMLKSDQAGWEALLADCKGWQSVGLFPVTVLPPPSTPPS